MNITVASIFSNAAYYLERYFEQMADFRNLLEESGHNLHLVLGWGDSQDGTYQCLVDELSGRFSATLIDVTHGGPVYGSVVDRKRFKQLAEIGNTLWGHLPDDADVVVWLESDLIWRASTLGSLLNDVEALRSVDSSGLGRIVLSPMIKHLDGRFYDTWAFRLNDQNFTNEAPYHPWLDKSVDFYQMDSVGSCVVMPAKYAKAATWPSKDVVVGLCAELREMGCRIFMDSRLEVYHP